VSDSASPRAWDMYSGTTTMADGTEEHIDFGSPWYVKAYGHETPVAVRLVEDPTGELTGWIETGDNQPTMIYRREVFPICFPYGVAAAVAAGHGEPVHLRVENREEA
jgi:hypothetical protein